MKTIAKEERCSEPNVSDGTGWHYAQCSRRGTITEEDKPWCFQHAPSAKRERRAESDARYKADQERQMAPYRERDRLRAVNAKLLEALEETATERHKDAYPINNLHALAFTDCRESRCVQARAVIEEARK